MDPAAYPDVNPLISTTAGQSPTAQQITGKPTATPSPSPSAASPAPSSLVPVLVGGGIILLILIMAIVLVIVFATRRAKRTGALQ